MDITLLRYRLRQAPLDFLTAIVSTTSLHVFDKGWRSLRKDVEQALQLSLLDDEDLSLVRATATQVSIWGNLFLETNDEADRRTSSFIDEVEGVFARLTISNVDHVARLPLSPPSAYRRSSRSVPAYIPAAYSWILQNIHDPYPSSQTKERIIRDAGRPLRVITDWFKEVRRHIGWVSICKNHFQGSRALAVQAAKRAYLQTDSTPQLSSGIISEFDAIRTRLRDLYPTTNDDGDLSDSTDDSFTPSPLSPRGYPSDQSSYARSRSSSSTPSLTFSTDDEDSHSLASSTFDDAPLASLGKRKNLTEENVSRPLKRNRSGYISVADGLTEDAVSASTMFSRNVPRGPSPSHTSPISSRKRRISDVATEWEDVTPLSSLLTQSDSRPPLRIPKRRLSVSDSQPTPKRPCLPPAVGPRKQVVSTPIPIAHQTTPAVAEWFPFELPDRSLSVELFNWDVVVDNDAFLYNSLFDNIFQSDGQDSSNVTPLSDEYQSPTPLDLGISSAVDPSVLDISSAFIEPRPTQFMASIPTFSPEPITVTTTPVFDFDAFLSSVSAEPTESQSTQSSSSPSTALFLNDSIELFGDL